jgi:hypothetical protein
MSERAFQLGRIHLHKLLLLPVHKKGTVQHLAELALISSYQSPEAMLRLMTLDVLFIDELGQWSASGKGNLQMIKKLCIFYYIFCKFPLFLHPFPKLMPKLYKTPAFLHEPLQCKTTQWNHLLYFTAISCYASIGSIKFSGNPHNYCCYT